ncbi:multidrug efflux pump subunit AcrA (membrane-fusion protein) [Clostridium algifaecis]|uniref:Multidrug efflux pump subunit AcrA (Membrane-fusion protein) n=1 Tax=Clostridium algifaecis TaxID=1472040 RepID=A0ABS4KVF6_9CLOT|nr:efflux RND transporter periplasmic adaptor subunit [Clostridium algifaecis]MBP2033590.1 multidrug efflux pump subunit AcrA (membrane-fusion protein) [Clostridium algifaecis]
MIKVNKLIRTIIEAIKKKKRICIIALAAFVVAAVGGSIFLGRKKIPKISSNMNKVSVKVIEANMDTVTSKESFKASLEASQEGAVSNKIAGKVTQVLFEDGQTVSAGQVLAKLDDTDIRNNIKADEAQLTAAEAQFKSAQSSASSAQLGVNKPQIDLETAQNNYNRTKALYDQGAATKVDLENAESQLKTAESALQSAKASAQASSISTQAQAANIQTAQTNLDNLNESLQNAVITAPTSGVMTGKSINVGQYLSPGAALGKVETISPIYAVIDIRESDLSYVKLGVKAKFKLGDDSLKEYDGVVKSIDAAADPTSRVFKCKIQIDNKDGKLKPGVFGSVEIATDQNKKAITAPLKAIGGTEGNYYVFIDNNGAAKKQNITIGEFDKDNVEIKSGVQTGDEVICTNVGTLQDGDVVKVVSE